MWVGVLFFLFFPSFLSVPLSTWFTAICLSFFFSSWIVTLSKSDPLYLSLFHSCTLSLYFSLSVSCYHSLSLTNLLNLSLYSSPYLYMSISPYLHLSLALSLSLSLFSSIYFFGVFQLSLSLSLSHHPLKICLTFKTGQPDFPAEKQWFQSTQPKNGQKKPFPPPKGKFVHICFAPVAGEVFLLCLSCITAEKTVVFQDTFTNFWNLEDKIPKIIIFQNLWSARNPVKTRNIKISKPQPWKSLFYSVFQKQHQGKEGNRWKTPKSEHRREFQASVQKWAFLKGDNNFVYKFALPKNTQKPRNNLQKPLFL